MKLRNQVAWIGLAALTAGCAGGSAIRHDSSDQEVSAQELRAWSVAWLDRLERESRKPAAEDHATDESADSLDSITDLRAWIQDHLDRLQEIYFRAHSSMQQYDRLLDEKEASGASLEEFQEQAVSSGIYPRLLSLRVYREEVIQQLTDAYQKLLKQDNVRSRDALNFMHQYLREVPGASRIPLHELAMEIQAIAPDTEEVRAALQRLLFNNGADLPAFARQPAVHAEVERISGRLEAASTYVQRRIQSAARVIADQVKADSSRGSGRNPQSDKIQPGTGKNGNITGNTFPNGVWSITFDDGPLRKHTSRVLKNLEHHGMKSTFFVLAQNATADAKIIQEELAAGMEVANHSYSHAQLTKLDGDKLSHEIKDSTRDIQKVTGKKLRFFRCPYGAGVSVERIRKMIADLGMIHVFWNVDTLDWQDKDPSSILARAKKEMGMAKNGGGVILFHDIHPQSVTASGMLMDHMKSSGKEVLSVGAVVDRLNGEN